MAIATVNTEIEAVVSVSGGYNGDNPREFFIDDKELDSLYMFGRDWGRAELVEVFGKQGADALEGLIFDLVDDWEDD